MAKKEAAEEEVVSPPTFDVDINFVVKSLQRQLSKAHDEIALKDAYIEQVMAENTKLKESIDAAASIPHHNGRVTKPAVVPKGRKKGKG